MAMSATCTTAAREGVRVRCGVDATVAVMTVTGRWDPDLSDAATVAVHECLAGHPEALIIDLSHLHDPSSLSAATWASARRAAAGLDPSLQLAICVPPDLPLADRLQHGGSKGLLPIFARVAQARVAIAARLPRAERMVIGLQPEAEAPSLARNLVTDACLGWRMPRLLHTGRMVMSELVTNAVEHARTPLTVMVARRGPGLHLSVADGSDDGPQLRRVARPRPGRPLDERGRGLRIVGSVAATWGWLPGPDEEGKVVWAVIAPR